MVFTLTMSTAIACIGQNSAPLDAQSSLAAATRRLPGPLSSEEQNPKVGKYNRFVGWPQGMNCARGFFKFVCRN